MKKIKIAFVKFGGLAAGGTEKALQTIAANLPKDKFDVDYYYCDAAPYLGSDYKHGDTDPHRKAYMESKNVNLIKFNVAFKDVRNPVHTWVDTNFWDLFKESEYDILQTGRSGHPEYPFTQINNITQIDLITLPGMAERKPNVYKTVHISAFQANTWIQAGGDPSKIAIIPLFDEMPKITTKNFRKNLGLKKQFVFGLHQRDDDGIYSPVPLMAYKRVELEHDDVAFVLMGGSVKYKEQAVALGLKNFHHLPHSGDKNQIHEFLQTLDVYAHGRADGETFSLAISEALYHGLPVISHIAPAMGHVETIGDAGLVAHSLEEYTGEMLKLKQNKEHYDSLKKIATERFANNFSLEANINKFVELYIEASKSNMLIKSDDDWINDWLND